MNAIYPRLFKTPIMIERAARMDPVNLERFIDEGACAIPIGRPRTIEELGQLVSFLASDE